MPPVSCQSPSSILYYFWYFLSMKLFLKYEASYFCKPIIKCSQCHLSFISFLDVFIQQELGGRMCLLNIYKTGEEWMKCYLSRVWHRRNIINSCSRNFKCGWCRNKCVPLIHSKSWEMNSRHVCYGVFTARPGRWIAGTHDIWLIHSHQ